MLLARADWPSLEVISQEVLFTSEHRVACGEQTHFSAFISPAEKIALFSAGEARAEKCVCSPQAKHRAARETLKIDHFSVNCYRYSSFWRYSTCVVYTKTIIHLGVGE